MNASPNTKIVLITGATSGIGEATAIQFAQNGYRLILTGRRANRLKALSDRLQQDFGAEALNLTFDVRELEQVKAAIESIPADWKNIDILINNAGLALGKEPIHEGRIADWDQMIDTNIKGLLYMTRLISPAMAERKSGHIINIGSTAGKEVYPGGNVYCGTKWAVEALTKSMRLDLVPFGIKVTGICPGLVETEFSVVRFKGNQNKADNVYQGFDPLVAADIANVIWFAASLPAHVCLNDVTLTCTAQADSRTVVKQQ